MGLVIMKRKRSALQTTVGRQCLIKWGERFGSQPV
jgi:hypothetical protein